MKHLYLQILVGTKIDLAEKRCISKITTEEFAAENGNIKYIEVSSKDCTNVESFVQVGRHGFFNIKKYI